MKRSSSLVERPQDEKKSWATGVLFDGVTVKAPGNPANRCFATDQVKDTRSGKAGSAKSTLMKCPQNHEKGLIGPCS